MKHLTILAFMFVVFLVTSCVSEGSKKCKDNQVLVNGYCVMKEQSAVVVPTLAVIPTIAPTVKPTIIPTAAPTLKPIITPAPIPTPRATIAPTPTPTVVPQLSCGNIASGEYEVRTMYREAAVSEGGNCVSETQNRKCVNGQFASWSGTYTQSKCTISRVRYENSTVNAGATCKAETQLMTCEKAICGLWLPANFTYTTCSTQIVPNNQTVEIQMLQSVRRHDITWTFDKKYPVAQYVNGDYAVIAPAEGVKISTVSPAPLEGQNGSGVNIKTKTQPADSRGMHFVQGITSFPIILKAGDSIVSFKSLQTSDHNCPPDNYGSNYRNIMGYCDRSFVKGASVLTIVDKAPVYNEFRPTPLGDKTNRRNYVLNNIDEVVKNLPKYVVSEKNKYDIAKFIRSKERFQYEAVGNWGRRFSAPADNQSGYAAYSTNGDALLALAVDYPEELKKQLLINVIQHGIDLEGASRLGLLMAGPDGGHGTHQLSVMAVTSALLGNADYTSYIKNVNGAEKGHTYIGMNDVALWGQSCLTYGSSFKAICIDNNYQKGAKDCRDPDGKYDELNKPNPWSCVIYQTLNGPYYPAQALAMGLLGAIDDFNHSPFFKYTDRWMLLNGTTSSSFSKEMWQNHRSKIKW